MYLLEILKLEKTDDHFTPFTKKGKKILTVNISLFHGIFPEYRLLKG